MYRALFTADWQLCNSLPHARVLEHGNTNRLLDQIKVVRRIREVAAAEKVDAIWVLGDIYEKRLLDAITLRCGVLAVLGLAEVAHVFLMAGNHDANSSRGARFLPEMFGELGDERVTYLDGSTAWREVAGKLAIDFHPVPWCPLDQAREHIGRHRVKAQQVGRVDLNVLLLHHAIFGCRDGGWVCDDGLTPDEVCEGFDLVLGGHFHDRQKFGDCGEFVGAPMQHDFGDAGAAPRGVRIVEFGKKKITKRFIEIDSPKFHIREWGGGGPDATEDADEIRAGDYLRLEVRATHAEWKARRPEVEDTVKAWRERGVLALDPKHVPVLQVEERMALAEVPTHDGVISRYVEAADTTGLDEKQLLALGRELLEEVRDG